MSLDFERPPINEVVLGVFFAPVPPLRAEAIGFFWARIRDAFGSVIQQPVYTQQVLSLPQPGELFPLPRFWFLSQDKSRLIQLQNGGFLYNWRRQDGDYPRFDKIFVEFLGHLKTFQKFLKEDLTVDIPSFTSAELTYINVFGALESLAQPADYKRVVGTFSDQSKELDQNLSLESFHHVDLFRSPNGNHMLVTQRSGRLPREDRTNFILELKVTGPLAVPLEDWFGNAHNRINESFVRLTTPEMQTMVWRKK